MSGCWRLLLIAPARTAGIIYAAEFTFPLGVAHAANAVTTMADNSIDSAPQSASGTACVVGVGGATQFPSASTQTPDFASVSNESEPMPSSPAAVHTAWTDAGRATTVGALDDRSDDTVPGQRLLGVQTPAVINRGTDRHR